MALTGVEDWYNNPDHYPDYKIQLCDGRIVRVHKAIICNDNEFFKNLVEGKETLPDCKTRYKELTFSKCKMHSNALDIIIRKQYGHDIPSEVNKSWAFWYQLAKTAAVCGDIRLCADAHNRSTRQALRETDVDVVVDILEFIQPHWTSVARELRQHHAQKLLRNRRYRKMLDDNKELMWEQLDAFTNVVETSTSGATSK